MKNLGVYMVILLLLGCTAKKESSLFRVHSGTKLGIDFQNTIITSDSFNALSYEYIYNGAGVGIADFNDDGLEDIYLAGNQVSSELYLNDGGLRFRKVTRDAGAQTDRWVTGVSVADVNNDGMMDIYLSVAGNSTGLGRENILLINTGVENGIPKFEDRAVQYGLNDSSYTTTSAFFDYDKDGDLDVYLVNNWLESFNRNNLRAKRVNGEAPSTDKLYRNNGNATFTDVSKDAGILIEGYGLGINICDINNDSWPDVYVANDFMSNDLLWINQHDGTFVNQIDKYLKHQSHNGMGTDIADFNNDLLPDIVVVDMLPPGHVRQKMMTPGQNYDHFHLGEQMGYQPQYMRNTLQLNRGMRDDGTVMFSEVAFLAGVSSTDWSWAPLFADFDNDGRKDLFVANGYRKDVTDLDFIFFGIKGASPFGTPEKRKEKFNSELDALPDVKLPNRLFRNTGTLQFEDKTSAWGADIATFSNGAAYADLDNDGDLDLITNNIDQEVIIYENTAATGENHYLQIEGGPRLLNCKVRVYADGKVQYQEFTPFRGFESTVTQRIHFGVGKATRIDSIVMETPYQTGAIFRNIKSDTLLRVLTLDTLNNSPVGSPLQTALFRRSDRLNYSHHEKSPPDIKITRTLLHELTRFGPCLAVADVNGDELDDMYVGGEKGVGGTLFKQRPDGSFEGTTFAADAASDDGDAHFFDVDQDSDLDLYVASSCSSSAQEAGPHRLYTNDGRGNFVLQEDMLPRITTSTSCVRSCDYDNDGDLDLFVGGRLQPGRYPLPARSFVLQNRGSRFVDVTKELHEKLELPGMVTDAAWADINGDKRSDLVLLGEWMPVRAFVNEGKSFRDASAELKLGGTDGWWASVVVEDLNNDGYPEIIAGNTGTNSFFRPNATQPVKITASDFDKNGSIDPIVTYYNEVEKDEFMVHNRLVLIDQIPKIKGRFETFRQYATSPFSKSFRADEMEGSYEGIAYTLTSTIFWNNGGREFKQKALPEVAQLSVINDLDVTDLNHDGHLDIVCVGNSYSQETLFGRYDASFGTILLGDGKGNWIAPEPSESHFIVPGDAKFMGWIRSGRGKTLIVTNNNGPIQLFDLLTPEKNVAAK